MPLLSHFQSPARRTAFAAVFLAGIALFLFWSLIFGGKALYFGDIGLYFGPMLAFQRSELLAGRLTLWNPHLLCGTPFWGNPQSWPLYPSSLLLWMLPGPVAAGSIGALHCLWAAWGMLFFLRRTGRGSAASVLGAVTFGFGGFLVSKMQFPNMVQAASYLPWLLWGLEGGVARPTNVRCVAILGLLFGLALLAAHPQMTLMQLYLCGAYTFWRMPRRQHRIAGVASGVAILLGAMLAAGYLLPTAEMALASVRTHLTLAQANRFILPGYAALTNFVAPNFYGNPASAPPFVARGNYWEACCYAGIIPFVLAVAAMLLCWRDRMVRFWMGAALIGFWLALGRDAGLYAVAFYGLPGVSRFHDAGRWLHLATFALAVLAAYGLEGLRGGVKPKWQPPIVLTLVVLTLADLLPFVATLNPVLPIAVYDGASRPVSSVGRQWYADEGRLWGRFVSYRSYDEVNDPEAAQRLLESRGPNLTLFSGGSEVGGYEPVRRADIDALLTAIKRDREASPLLPMMGVGSVVHAGHEMRPVASPVSVFHSRALLWRELRTTATVEDALAAVTRTDWDGVPIVTGLQTLGSNLVAPPVTALVVDETPQSVVVSLPKGHSQGLLVLADVAHPGWHAEVDGVPMPIRQVNGAFRGVMLSADARNVQFRYDPTTVRLGTFISLLALGILVALSLTKRE